MFLLSKRLIKMMKYEYMHGGLVIGRKEGAGFDWYILEGQDWRAEVPDTSELTDSAVIGQIYELLGYFPGIGIMKRVTKVKGEKIIESVELDSLMGGSIPDIAKECKLTPLTIYDGDEYRILQKTDQNEHIMISADIIDMIDRLNLNEGESNVIGPVTTSHRVFWQTNECKLTALIHTPAYSKTDQIMRNIRNVVLLPDPENRETDRNIELSEEDEDEQEEA